MGGCVCVWGVWSRGSVQYWGHFHVFCCEELLEGLLCCHLQCLYLQSAGCVEQGRRYIHPSLFNIKEMWLCTGTLCFSSETITALFKTRFRLDFPFDLQELPAFAILGWVLPLYPHQLIPDQINARWAFSFLSSLPCELGIKLTSNPDDLQLMASFT